LSKQTNNIVANKICVVSKIGLGTGIFGKMAVKGLTSTSLYRTATILHKTHRSDKAIAESRLYTQLL